MNSNCWRQVGSIKGWSLTVEGLQSSKGQSDPQRCVTESTGGPKEMRNHSHNDFVIALYFQRWPRVRELKNRSCSVLHSGTHDQTAEIHHRFTNSGCYFQSWSSLIESYDSFWSFVAGWQQLPPVPPWATNSHKSMVFQVSGWLCCSIHVELK